ncbi:MAG: alpha-1,2-fucosyltransferase, partial [Lachnospiraceae bacterium]|nr:alpha-1,2-fucosyltransferase [Lachnospiraceae bacterium]
LHGADCYFVEGNTKTESFRDMQLMSLCRHHIVANSSFSWWGAWLNQNPDKIVIAPKRWINHPEEEKTDMIPENWIRISG